MYLWGRQAFSSLGKLVLLLRADLMDFQCAWNLSAINRAQQTLDKALLHIGECTDCLNREVILPVSDSDEAEQLLEAARTDLLRVQTILTILQWKGGFGPRKWPSYWIAQLERTLRLNRVFPSIVTMPNIFRHYPERFA